jgi:hypothetical protein
MVEEAWMKHSFPPLMLSLVVAGTLISQASAKDDPVKLEECPAAVQAVIRHYTSQATLEGIGLDKKSKSGGPPVYEAKFRGKDGNRVEVHISPEGKVLQFEQKKRKD